MTEHTPTPWKFDGDWHRLPTIYGADGKMVAYVEKDERKATPERAANAALIIRAVNNHDALVKHLHHLATVCCDEDALRLIDSLGGVVGSSGKSDG